MLFQKSVQRGPLKYKQLSGHQKPREQREKHSYSPKPTQLRPAGGDTLSAQNGHK